MNTTIEKKNDLLDVRSDRLFHDLFNENEISTIEWVAMQILECSHEDIEGKVTIGNIRLPNTTKDGREKYVDLIIKLSDEEQILIELNNHFNGNYLRNLIYAFEIINNNYNVGERNHELAKKKVRIILVNLNWSDYEPKFTKEVIEYPYPSDKIDGYLLKIINLNLDCYNKFCYNEIDYVDRLAKLLTITDKEEMQDVINQERLLKSYYNKLSYLSDDSEYRKGLMNENIEKTMEYVDAYNDGLNDGWHQAMDKGIEQGIEQGIVQGIEQGIEQGIVQGIERNRKQMVLKMYQEKIDINTISKCTNLSKEEIENIINNN